MLLILEVADAVNRAMLDETKIKNLRVALLIWTAVMAYFSQPLLSFAPPATLFSCGLLIATSVMSLWFATKDEKSWHLWGWFFITVGSIALMTWVALRAVAVSNANDARRLAIQHEMLSAEQRRSDLPDLFQALACRVQGEEGLSLPKPKPEPQRPKRTE